MTRKQIGAVLGAVVLAVIAPLLVLALLHGAGGTAQANGPPDPYSKDSMPDFGQHSKSWCWVGAASNSFWWFAQTGGYPELMNPGDKYIEPLSRDATPAAPDLYDPHDLDGDTVTNEPDGVPDWFDYNDRPEGTGLIYDGTCGDYADNDGDTLYDFTGLIWNPAPPPVGPVPPDPDCTSFVPPLGDDDIDGMVDEDPINGGVDEDGDSLVDEDPIDIPPFDDDGDTLFDEDPPALDDDGDGLFDEDGVVGYRTLLKKVAQTVWRDTNQNGIRDPNERNYAYSEAVEKWDYLCGLQKYIDDHGAALQVHDLLHPNYTGKGITPPTDENRGAMSWSRPSQLTAQAAQNCGVSQVVRIPTLDDYKTELARSQDVLVWMCRKNAQGDYYCHVVTAQGYDTTDPNPANHFITVSDPWTHNANLHDDTWGQWTGPDHNNDPKHSDPAYPGEDPYDDCTVFTPGSNAPAQDFVIDCGGTVWTVIDLIFISPEGPDVKVVDWWAPSPIEIMTVPGVETILVQEVKHNNGPGDATASATWTATSSDPGGLGVTWVPKGGDSQPEPGVLEFEVTLPESNSVIPDRYLELEGLIAGQYSVTLINEEWPMAGYDRDPSNNVATTTIFVNVGTLAGSVDKEVLDIIFDDADNYPDEGADIGNEWWINKSENVPFSVTSVDINNGPDDAGDVEISFYMDVPQGCSARWYDPAGHFHADIETIGGDENVGSSGVVWDPPAKEAGPVMLDLHFQTAEYGLYEPAGDEQRYTRFFEIHCYDAGDYVFRFCNRADVKYDYDPYPDDNLLCEDLTIHSLHNADIKVLTFYSDPAPPFTFDVSTYNVIDLIENKHNNGPQDAWSSVWWSMDPIEDRDLDGIPDINVRWEAQIGDFCTYQGAPVACGEGDGVGTGGSADGNPSLTGDNCQDDVDNDGDGTCDINGCTAFPGMGDPDCKVDIDDIQFAVWLPVSADQMVSRPLKLHCKPRSDPYPYTLTLYNEEWPFNPDNPGEEWVDPEPENNFQQLDIDVTCQVADPHYKCYDILDADAPSVGELVTLEDQFHTQTGVEVTYPQVLCPPAIKYVDGQYAGGGTAAPHLKCYSIVGMPDANVTVNLTTQFGTETDIDVGMATRLCVPALKAIYPDLPTGELPTEPHYVCYDTMGGVAPPPGLIIDVETQFGTESDVQLYDTYGRLCAPAKKDGIGNLDAPHLRCYLIDTFENPPHIVNLFTQFIPEMEIDVGYPEMLCVPAEKEIVPEADSVVTEVGYDDLGEDRDPVTPELDILKSSNITIDIYSTEHNIGPVYADSEITFLADIPAGCEGQWLNETHTMRNYTPGYPMDQDVGQGPTPDKDPGDGIAGTAESVVETGVIPEPVSIDQTLWEPFELHCLEPGLHTFTFCNKQEVEPPEIDPNLTNSFLCFDLVVNSLHNADIESVNWTAPSPQTGYVGVPFTITVDEDKHNHGPQPADSDVTWTATAPAGVTAVWVDSGTSVLNFTVDLTAISVTLPLSRDLQITCEQAGGPYTITLQNDEWPIDPATGAPWEDPDPTNNSDTTFVEVTCEEMPEEVDLEKSDLYVKPFYCGDSDMDGLEDGDVGGGTIPGTGNCCDGADNDGDTLTDGQDPDCTPYINEDPVDGLDDDDDGLIDEDPPDWPSGQSCPWNGDDDCDGSVDEDPKNGEDDDHDGLIDEDPANGFLGIDNDRDGSVDEDGAGTFDWDGDTAIDEVQLEGVDDDGDTWVDEDPLDSPVPRAGEVADPDVKWAQMPDDSPWGLDVSAYDPFVLADDFPCDETGYITQIDFWASWYMDDPPMGDPESVSFDLSIHPDVPAGVDLPWSHPGEMLWTYTFDPYQCTAQLWGTGDEGWLDPPDYYEPSADSQIWFYECPIPEEEWFPQEAGNIYWLDIQATPVPLISLFGWKTSIDHWNDDGTWAMGAEPIDPLDWSELRYPPGHPLFPESIDLAFQIWGAAEGPPVIHEPHYLVKELLRNLGPYAVTADVTTEIDAPAWRADAWEDGHTTCNDGLDNDLDGGCDAVPDFCWPGSVPDDQCLDEHIGEERAGLHACNDGLDNGDGVPEPPGDDLIDELDDDCQTKTEVSVECADEGDFITVKPGVPWYVKPPSDSMEAMLFCPEYFDPDNFNKCVPCKIPMGVGPVDEYCGALVPGPGYCIAVDSVPDVYKELDLHQQVDLPYQTYNLHLQVPEGIVDPVALGPPIGSAWRELYPMYVPWPEFNWIMTSWADNDDSGDLSVDDQIDMEPAGDASPKTWFHVDEVTQTVCLDDPGLPGLEMMCIEPLPPTSIYDPFLGPWHEKWPEFSDECWFMDWMDNDGDHRLSFCDDVIVQCMTWPEPVALHVLDVAIDIWATEKVLLEHQFDLSCEGKVGQHKFIIQNEVQPAVGIDPIQANNELEMELLVECRSCLTGVDSDGDGFNDDVECYLRTDPTDDCPDVTGSLGLCPGPSCDGHDAWPMDNSVDKILTAVGDVLPYSGKMQWTVTAHPEVRRLDLNWDGIITAVGDVFLYSGRMQETCT